MLEQMVAHVLTGAGSTVSVCATTLAALEYAGRRAALGSWHHVSDPCPRKGNTAAFIQPKHHTIMTFVAASLVQYP